MPLHLTALALCLLLPGLAATAAGASDEATAEKAAEAHRLALAGSYAAHTAAAQMALELGRPLEAQSWLDATPDEELDVGNPWELGFLQRSIYQNEGNLGPGRLLAFDAKTRPEGSEPEFLLASRSGGLELVKGEAVVRLEPPNDAAPVRQVELVGDESSVLALSDDGLRRFDLETGEKSAPLALEGQTTCLAASPDGSVAAVGAWRRDAETRRPEGLLHLVDVRTLELRETRTFGYIVSAVAWDPEGVRLVGCTWNATCGVWRRDRAEPVLTFELEAAEGYPAVQDVAFSPDGEQLAVATKEGLLRLYDASSGELRRILDLGRTAWVNAVAYLGDGMVAGGTSDGRIGIFDAQTGEAIDELYGATSAIRSVRRIGDRLVTREEHGGLRLWARPSRQHRDRLAHRSDAAAEDVWAFDVSADGSRAASASSAGVVRLWDLETAREVWRVAGHEGEASGVLLFDHPTTGEPRVVSGANDGRLRLWHGDTGRPLGDFEAIDDGRAIGMALSPDGWYLAAGSSAGSVKIWDLRAAVGSEPAATLAGHAGEVWRILWTETQIVTVSRDGTFRLWDPRNWRHLKTVAAHDGTIHGATLSPDGTRFATAGADGQVRVWSSSTGRALARRFQHPERVYDVAWSPDGARLVTVSEDFTAKIWSASDDLVVDRPLLTFHYDHQVYQAHWSADGSTLFVLPMDGIVRILRSR